MDYSSFFENKNYNMGLEKNRETKFWVDKKKGKYVIRTKCPIDQKCTADVIMCVAAGIIEYTKGEHSKVFCKNDIWKSDFMSCYVQRFFTKPDPKTEASSEYDKFFSQPINLLEYAGVLKCVGHKKGCGNNYYFRIVDLQVLEAVSTRTLDALDFMTQYVSKLVCDSHLDSYFDDFFKEQSSDSYIRLRKKFFAYYGKKTNKSAKKKKEIGRIFTKVLNVLALERGSKGTYKGKMSSRPIDYSEILYNRVNWRFEKTSKDKRITREAFLDMQKKEKDQVEIIIEQYGVTSLENAKKRLKEYNNRIRGGMPELKYHARGDKATEAHHIFPQNEERYKIIRAFTENLIMLSDHQHGLAHGDDNRYIDIEFRNRCILEKIERIREYFKIEDAGLYSFERLIFVLNTGLETDVFNDIMPGDYDEVIRRFKKIIDSSNKEIKCDSNTVQTRHNIVSLFAGCGGLDLGFEQAGFTVSCSVENDRRLWETYEINHPNTRLYRCDIHQVTVDMIRKSVGGEIEGVIAGLPIQSESISVKSGEKCSGGVSLTEYFRLLKGLSPKFFWINSASGITKVNNGKVVDKIIEMANDAGYDATYYVVNAKDYNIAQDRKIFLCVGFRKDLGIDFKIPSGSTSNSEKLTLRDAIADLQETAVPAGDRSHPNPNARNNNEYYNGPFSTLYMSANRVKSWDEQGYTVQASGGMSQIHPQAPKMVPCGQRKFKFVEEKEKLYRRITIREAARLQGFPDEYRFVYNNVETGYMMVGHALPINVAYEIASEIMQLLNT